MQTVPEGVPGRLQKKTEMCQTESPAENFRGTFSDIQKTVSRTGTEKRVKSRKRNKNRNKNRKSPCV